MKLQDLVGYSLGDRCVTYEDRDAMLYALAVGAGAADIDLVYEQQLEVLPTYACALGTWAVEEAGELGAYDRRRSLHAAQTLRLHRPMPAGGRIETTGRVTGVWDKGKAAVVEIETTSEVFTAGYAIFLPGLGGWGGQRGPSTPVSEPIGDGAWRGRFVTSTEQAALYRLTGDRHPIHIDADVARANGFDRPILHGLCTLGIVAREIAAAARAHPADLVSLDARLTAPVLPGDPIDIVASGDGAVRFEASVAGTAVVTAGRAEFRARSRALP